jgi:hypothetical protein
MQPNHPVIASALVEQRQADFRRQADHWRLAHSARAGRRPSQLANRVLLDLVGRLAVGGATIAGWAGPTRRRLRRGLGPVAPR